MTGHLLQEPHHDGSPLYLSDEAPALESEVVVRLRTDPGDPLEAVWTDRRSAAVHGAPGPPLDLPITVGETVVATADDPLTTGVTVYAV